MDCCKKTEIRRSGQASRRREEPRERTRSGTGSLGERIQVAELQHLPQVLDPTRRGVELQAHTPHLFCVFLQGGQDGQGEESLPMFLHQMFRSTMYRPRPR